MIQQEMRFEQIDPFVRAALALPLTPKNPPQATVAYDHRIFYVAGGSGTLEIEGSLTDIKAGTVMYWMSGTPYTLQPSGDGLQILVINFDFTQHNAADALAHPPVTPRNYDPDRLLESIRFSNAPVLNKPMVLRDFPTVLPYLQTMVQEAMLPTLWSNFQLSSLLRVVLTCLCRANAYSGTTKRLSDSFQQLLRYIHDHYTEPLSNSSLAKLFNYHPNYISQMFTQHMGISLHQYLLRIRVQQALYLLQTTDLPISEVAVKAGFGNVSYFCQYFKKSTGYPPSSFRL